MSAELAMNRAQSAAILLEEHAVTVVAADVQHCRGPFRQRSTKAEHFLARELAAEVHDPRFIGSALDRNRPTRRAAGTCVLAQIVSVQVQAIVRHRDEPCSTDRLSVSRRTVPFLKGDY